MEDQFKGSMWHNEFPNPNKGQGKGRLSRENDSISKIYWSIGEVAKILKENSSALRFWESQCHWLKVKKNKKGNRAYTSNNIESIGNVLFLTRWLGVTEAGINQAYDLGYFNRLLELAKQEQEKAIKNEIKSN